jgi:hypothetical protein
MTRGLPCALCRVIFLAAPVIVTLSLRVSAHMGPTSYEMVLPGLNPELPASAQENQPLLYQRLLMAFGADYGTYLTDHPHRDLSDGMTVYYLRQELQALTDMWRATGKSTYLDLATDLTLQAIEAATSNRQPLLYHEQHRGDWPCFYLESVQAQTGGHSQLCDFQGCAGFLNVACILQQLNRPEWEPITDFVEYEVIEKWLYYKPGITPWDITIGPRSLQDLLVILNAARDVREHFACICLDLHHLGRRDYPYDAWARLLIDLYLTPRYDPNQAAPYQDEMPDSIPANWGLFARPGPDGQIWLAVPNYDPARWSEPMDTSHANRVAWLAAKAYAEGFVKLEVITGLINTFRYQIWAPDKGPFYFNNYADGSDGEMNGLSSGRGGNVWFGWHRLAAHDDGLRNLFLDLAYDLTAGGQNLPDGAQNKSMANAQTCLEAWAARLLADKGYPWIFP